MSGADSSNANSAEQDLVRMETDPQNSHNISEEVHETINQEANDDQQAENREDGDGESGQPGTEEAEEGKRAKKSKAWDDFREVVVKGKRKAECIHCLTK